MTEEVSIKDLKQVGWECACGEEFVGDITPPFDGIENHVVECDEVHPMVEEVLSGSQED